MGEPVINTANLLTAVAGTGALSTGLVAKIVWDWLSNNRQKKVAPALEYVTVAACAKNQLYCPQITKVKQDFIEHKTRVSTTLEQHNALLHDIAAGVKNMTIRMNKLDKAITIIATKIQK